MAIGRQLKRQDLFVVRFWAGEADNGATEWHGKVQRAVSGEEGYFDDWPQLVNLLSQMLSATGGPEAAKLGEGSEGRESRAGNQEVSPI